MALTNTILVFVVIVIGAVCFFPTSAPVSRVERKAYYRGSSRDGVSLMFNVYESAETVLEILSVLQEYGVRATFFIGGCWADDNTRCVREIAAAGHEIASHGYFHRDHGSMDYDENYREIHNSVAFLTQVTGKAVTLFAPPSGSYCDDTLRAAEALSLKTVMWSKDTIDWRDEDAALVFSRATKDVSGGDLILMHPKPHTLKALPEILTYYREHSLRVISVGENLADKRIKNCTYTYQEKLWYRRKLYRTACASS